MRTLSISSLSFTAFLMAGAAVAADLSIKDPWIREAPPNARALAAFAVLQNPSDKPRVLVAAHTPAAEKVELHRTVMEKDMAKMIPQPSIDVPAKGEVRLQPGGLHIMLIGPKQVLKAGDKVELVLEFKDGANIPATFPVRKGDAATPMDHEHSMQH